MSIAEIKQQLISRIIYAQKLIHFVEEVEKNNVSKEELDRFCIDIIGKKSSKPVAAIILFKPLLKELIESYQKMMTVCDGKNSSIAIAKLDLMVEDQIYTNNEIIKNFEALSADSVKWVRIISEEQMFFESLRQELKPQLPEFYHFLRKYLSFSLYNSEYNNFQKHRRQKINYVISVNFNEDLCSELATQYLFKSCLEPVNKKLYLLLGDEYKENLGTIADDWSALIPEKNNLVEKYVEQVKLALTANPEWLSYTINSTLTFYQALGMIKTKVIAGYQKLEMLADDEERKQNLFAQIKAIKPKIEKYAELCRRQQSSWQTYVPDAPKLNDSDLEEIAKKITICQKVLAIYFGDIDKVIEKNSGEDSIPTVEESRQFGVFCNKKLAEIKKILNQFAQYIVDHKTRSQHLVKQQMLQETLQAKEQKQQFTDQKQRCTFLWNAKVEEIRQAKEQAKLNARSKSIMPVDPLELQEKEKSEQLEIKRAAESLKHLSSHYIQLIKAIFCHEKGIFYDQVYYLITNQLKGKILERGNGSSHKTILLNNFSTCFISSGQLPTTIKSGIYQPHGKSHQSGELCGFNLELIQEALIKAGITPEVIDLLEEDKLSERFNKITL